MENPSTVNIDFSKLKKVGIVGMPPVDCIQQLNAHRIAIHDLDAKLVPQSVDGTSPYLPKVYCAILRTVVLNAMHLDLDAIFIDVGPGKCDSALHVSTILEGHLDIPIIRTINRDAVAYGTPISTSRLDLTSKFLQITEGVKAAARYESDSSPCEPRAGFWGVPPRDFSVLSPFPDTTHIYGWTRCMENKTPADEELEKQYNPEIPTVFFAQSFCAKTALAKFLAGQHPQALFVDVDFHTGSSARAKIQAFLELSGALR
jgi:hypothetical protein